MAKRLLGPGRIAHRVVENPFRGFEAESLITHHLLRLCILREIGCHGQARYTSIWSAYFGSAVSLIACSTMLDAMCFAAGR